MRQHLLIIVNNVASKARRAWPIIRGRLEASAIEFQSYETTQAGDAIDRTRAALKAGCRTVAIVGGDGTLSEAAEGFFEIDRLQAERPPSPINPDAALAVLPAGTGDDFARGIIGQRAALGQWIDILLAHCQGNRQETTRLIDVLYGSCDGFTRPFVCLNASTMGIGGETGARVAAQGTLMRCFSGKTRFMAAAVGGLVAWRERRVRVSVDEEQVVDAEMNLIAVANGIYAGGGMMLSPKAKIDDGKLDVLTASGLSRAGVIRELPRLHTGGHVANPKVKIMQGNKVRIETFAPEDALLIETDGNVRGRTPVEFRIMPRALRFVV